jgi:hypothetical protein
VYPLDTRTPSALIRGANSDEPGGDVSFGYSAAPLARRIHGVHRGHYLDKPEEIHASYDYSEVIFPQDIRKLHEMPFYREHQMGGRPVATGVPGVSR